MDAVVKVYRNRLSGSRDTDHQPLWLAGGDFVPARRGSGVRAAFAGE